MTERPSLVYSGRRWIAGLVGRVTVAGIAAIVALFLFSRFSAEFGEQGGRLPRFDQNVLDYFHLHRVGWLFQLAYSVSWLFRPWGQVAMVLIGATWFALQGRRDATFSLVLGAVGGGVVIGSLKALFGRPRSEEIFAPLGYSFPSGHTFMAVTILGIAGYFLAREVPASRRVWVWFVSGLGMFLVGWSRMYLGEHYPSDVGAGYTAAFCWVFVCLFVAKHFAEPRRSAEGGA
ncbi:MAG: phosphatase PAP2 family protein [Fibrella sp.]|nr:phosphatase PAP2 family protein [Armatimonadota bacterium]